MVCWALRSLGEVPESAPGGIRGRKVRILPPRPARTNDQRGARGLSERDELRGRLFMELLRYGRNTGHGTDETFECVDRILALLPPQPKLERPTVHGERVREAGNDA